MRSKDTTPPRPFNATESEPNFLGPILPEVTQVPTPDPFLTLPKFPTVEDLLSGKPHPLIQLSETQPPRDTPLFQALLGGRLEVLQQDALYNPERYDEATRHLLMELSVGSKAMTTLDAGDQTTLDRATVDYAQFRPPAGKKPKPPSAPRPKAVAVQDELGDGRAPQVETPGGTMSAYWWV